MRNIFQVYLDNDEKLPMVIRRGTWHPNFAIAIVEIEIQKYYKGDPYGMAKGFCLPVEGKEMNEYWGTPEKPKEISCSGCYQWEMHPYYPELPKTWYETIMGYYGSQSDRI